VRAWVGVDDFLSSSPPVKQLRVRVDVAAEKKPIRLEQGGSRALEYRGGGAGVHQLRARVDVLAPEKKGMQRGLEGWWGRR
jgi:hypothetical protein